MDFEECDDRLQMQVLAGGSLITHTPLYSHSGDHLFLINGAVIQVYATHTGEMVRQLVATDAEGLTNIISMEFELKEENVLVACTAGAEIFRWNWHTGILKNKKKILSLPPGRVVTFNLLNFYANSETACAFCTVKAGPKDAVLWQVINTSTGARMNVRCPLVLHKKAPIVAVDNKNFHNIVVVQSGHIFFVNYKNWSCIRLKNAYLVPMTCVRVHPSEELVATGDEHGKIFLWRQFWNKATVKTSLYHWHHTAVTSIAFTTSGTSFFSSGHEAVLVKWNVRQPEDRRFIPRMCAIIKHIAVSNDNTQMAVCTADNGVQILGADTEIKTTLQDFTYIADDKTNKSKFPMGLRKSPRSNTLVLNGRAGHLQFYSIYTKRLLYNMDIVQQNRLSMEKDKILYNIFVTKAAFNIDWMATGEVFNDEEHLPELRLKFWKYQEEAQSYVLNTNIELPHEGGFKAIEFSNEYQVENLLCATVGEDNTIKIWTLDESDNIYKKGKVWYCNAQTSYKNMPIESISFSQDGSLLAAGFGNTLCIYKAETLKLKAALTSSPGYDGSIKKAQVRVSQQKVNGSRNELVEQRKRLMELFTNLLENNDETLVKELQKTLKSKKSENLNAAHTMKTLDKIDDKQKALLYEKILQMPELNLYQKLMLYQKLGIQCQVHPQWQAKMIEYLKNTVDRGQLKKKTSQLHVQLQRINYRDRFKAKYRLHEYQRRLRNYDQEITNNLVPIMAVLNLNKTTKPAHLTNGEGNSKSSKTADKSETLFRNDDNYRIKPPSQTLAEISQVQFAAGDSAHLVIACTENRVLVWNLLTLRLKSILKLSVKHLAFDPQTNLIAAFTKYNDLHVFQPNVPLPIYQRRSLPNIYGARWLPRRYPKQRSINVDWQSQSTLYFLTENQEIMYLDSSADSSIDVAPSVAFNAAASETLRYSTFGTYATQKYSDKESSTQQKGGPLILGNSGPSAVKSLIEMSSHTMPPLSLLCTDFVKSLVKTVESSANNATDNNNKANSKNMNGDSQRLRDEHMNGNATHTDDENDADNDDDDDANANNTETLKLRQDILMKTEEVAANANVKTIKQSERRNIDQLETQLKLAAAQNIDVTFEF